MQERIYVGEETHKILHKESRNFLQIAQRCPCESQIGQHSPNRAGLKVTATPKIYVKKLVIEERNTKTTRNIKGL